MDIMFLMYKITSLSMCTQETLSYSIGAITRISAGVCPSTVAQVERSGFYSNPRPSALGERTRALKFGEAELLQGERATRIMQVYSDSKRRPVVLGLTHAAYERTGS
jgi:hypothetical protein